jgi:DNA gyrase/topoisomerase IV subunit B
MKNLIEQRKAYHADPLYHMRYNGYVNIYIYKQTNTRKTLQTFTKYKNQIFGKTGKDFPPFFS